MAKSPKIAKPSSKAKPSSGKAVPAAVRYCAQPIQNPRQFDSAVNAMRARIDTRLINGRRYQIGLRLYYAEAAAETSIMVR